MVSGESNALKKMWRNDKIQFICFVVSLVCLSAVIIILIISLIQPIFSPGSPSNLLWNGIPIFLLFMIPALFAVPIFQSRISSQATTIENKINDLNKSVLQKSDNKILVEIQKKKHKNFYYLNLDSMRQLVAQIDGGVNPKTLQLKENGHISTSINGGAPLVAEGRLQVGEGQEKTTLFEISPTEYSQFDRVQNALIDNDEITFDLADVDDINKLEFPQGDDYDLDDWILETPTPIRVKTELPPVIKPEFQQKFANIYQTAFDITYKKELQDNIHNKIGNPETEKYILDFTSKFFAATVSSTLEKFSKREVINRTIAKIEKCKTYVILNEDFSLMSINDNPIILNFDHKINSNLEEGTSIKIQLVCEQMYFLKSQISVIQQAGNKINCVCLASNVRWDPERKMLTLMPIALYK